METKKFYTTCEVAKMVGVKAPTIIGWCNQGKLKCSKTLGKRGHRRISEKALEELKREMGIE